MFPVLILFLDIKFSRRAGLSVIQIFMWIEEMHLKISNKKFRLEGRPWIDNMDPLPTPKLRIIPSLGLPQS